MQATSYNLLVHFYDLSLFSFKIWVFYVVLIFHPFNKFSRHCVWPRLIKCQKKRPKQEFFFYFSIFFPSRRLLLKKWICFLLCSSKKGARVIPLYSFPPCHFPPNPIPAQQFDPWGGSHTSFKNFLDFVECSLSLSLFLFCFLFVWSNWFEEAQTRKVTYRQSGINILQLKTFQPFFS